MMVVLGCLAGAASAAMIYDDFSALPLGLTASKSGGFTWTEAKLTDKNYVSSPTCLRIGAGGSGTNPSYGIFTWSLGGDHDFYAGGTGACTIEVARMSTASWIRVELLDNGVSKSLAQYSFSDYNWHEVTVPLDSDDISIDTVKLTILRYSGTSSAYVDVDDFVVTPEPATVVMLLSGGLMTLRKRIRG